MAFDSKVETNQALLASELKHASFKRLDIHPLYLESVGSTQTYLSKEMNSEREGDLVIARVQTMGMGREGRSWVSQSGGVWLSLVLCPPSSRVLEKLVYVGANAILNTLEEYGAPSLIKPPNDVCCNGKKIAGILADTIVQGDLTLVYLGIGVNVNNDTSRDSSISEIATNLSKIIGHEIDLTEFVVKLLRNIDQLYFDEIEALVPHN